MSIREAEAFIANHSWRYAKTMPQIKHWYVVRDQCRSDEEYVAFVTLIRRWGYDSLFGKTKYRYLDIDGFKYFTMGYDVDSTTIINRAELAGEKATPWSEDAKEFKAKFYGASNRSYYLNIRGGDYSWRGGC